MPIILFIVFAIHLTKVAIKDSLGMAATELNRKISINSIAAITIALTMLYLDGFSFTRIKWFYHNGEEWLASNLEILIIFLLLIVLFSTMSGIAIYGSLKMVRLFKKESTKISTRLNEEK